MPPASLAAIELLETRAHAVGKVSVRVAVGTFAPVRQLQYPLHPSFFFEQPEGAAVPTHITDLNVPKDCLCPVSEVEDCAETCSFPPLSQHAFVVEQLQSPRVAAATALHAGLVAALSSAGNDDLRLRRDLLHCGYLSLCERPTLREREVADAVRRRG